MQKVASMLTKTTTMVLTDESEVIDLDSFNKEKIIGKGAYGSVYLVKMKSCGHLYAMKELNKDFILKNDKK